MPTFGEGIKDDYDDFDYNIMLESAVDIKQDIIERNRTQGGENGYDLITTIIKKDQYDSSKKRWVRILPNFEVKSAKLTLIGNNRWSLDSEDIEHIARALPLLRKWNIEEYCICNDFNHFLQFYQPVPQSATYEYK